MMTQKEQEILGKQMLALARIEGRKGTRFKSVPRGVPNNGTHTGGRPLGEVAGKVIDLFLTRGPLTCSQIVGHTGLDLQTIKNTVSNLRAAGRIETYRGGQGRKCTYRVVM